MHTPKKGVFLNIMEEVDKQGVVFPVEAGTCAHALHYCAGANFGVKRATIKDGCAGIEGNIKVKAAPLLGIPDSTCK